MKVAIDLPDDSLVLCCDRRLMTMLLSQYIDNACKYSIYGTTITIRAVQSKAEVIFSVHSFGPVIPMADRERIFDRYYRSSTRRIAQQAPASVCRWPSAQRRSTTDMSGSRATRMKATTFFAAIPAQARKRES